MISFNVLSDCHLEHNDIKIENKNNADLLFLAGDISCLADYYRDNDTIQHRTRYLFESVSEQYKQVYYTLGNHEYYMGKRDEVRNNALRLIDNFDNIFLVDNVNGYQYVYNDILIIGDTLWTNIRDIDEYSSYLVEHGMNDFKYIRNRDNTLFTSLDMLVEFNKTLKTIEAHINDYKDVIVMTHHAPSYNSIAPEFINHPLNGGYCSNLSEFILDHPQIKYFLHGHLHNKSNYMIGETNILNNPRGYGDNNIELINYFI